MSELRLAGEKKMRKERLLSAHHNIYDILSGHHLTYHESISVLYTLILEIYKDSLNEQGSGRNEQEFKDYINKQAEYMISELGGKP